MEENLEIAIFGGGCFWCTEAMFRELRGVEEVISGYVGCNKDYGQSGPSYEQVCTGETGAAEAIQIKFNSTEISFNNLLEIFFLTHDPTTLNRQGNDVGTQYRSSIFCADENQKKLAEEFIVELEKSGKFSKKIVTEVNILDQNGIGKFYEAEKYHQDYYNQNSYKPYCALVITPKLIEFRQKFKKLTK